MTEITALVALLARLDAADYLTENANDSGHLRNRQQNPVSPDIDKAA